MFNMSLKELIKLVDEFISRRSIVVIPSMLTLILLPLFQQLEVQTTTDSDFTQDYYAGKAVNKGVSIYNDDLQQVIIEDNYLKDYRYNKIENFHPPFVSIVFSLLANVDYLNAYRIYSYLTIICFLILATYSVNCLPLSNATKIIISFSLLYWNPIFICLNLGQMSCYIALGLICVYELSKRQRSVLSGIMLGFVSQFKLFPLFIIFYYLSKREYSAFFSALLSFFLFFIFTGFYLSFDEFYQYFVVMAPRDVAEWASYPTTTAITSIFYPIFTKSKYFIEFIDSKLTADIFVSITSIVVFALCVKKRDFTDDFHRFYTYIIAMMLISPVMWAHFYMVLLPLFLSWSFDEKRSLNSRIVIGGCFLVTFIKDIDLSRIICRYYMPEKVSLLYLPIMKIYIIILFVMFFLLLRTKVKKLTNNSF